MAYLCYQEPYKMRRISIFLIKVHRFYFLFLGALAALIVFYRVEHVNGMMPFEHLNPLILICIVFGIGYMQFIAMGMFYTEEELKNKDVDGDIRVMAGFVKWDKYFPEKINTELLLSERLYGYVYAFLRPVPYIATSYLLVAIVCLLTIK